MDGPPTHTDAALRATLLAMAAEDQRVRTELVADGTLFDGYHPRMAAVHRQHAARLAALMADGGWPGRQRVGEDGAAAAWLVLQHSIGDPAVMRRGLELMRAAPPGDVDPVWVAMLEDRVRVCSGQPQRYGTQFDWEDDGVMRPRPLDDPDGVDARRMAIGLPPLAEKLRELHDALARDGVRPPAAPAARRREIEAWERAVGWHD